MYLLDTNVVSELRKNKPHGAVLAWMQSVDAGQLSISAITIGEIQAGIELTRDLDSTKAVEIEQWLDRLPSAFGVVPFDAKAARIWARLMHRKSDALNEDAMIAAIAISRGLTVATRNTADFKILRVPVVNPFARQQSH